MANEELNLGEGDATDYKKSLPAGHESFYEVARVSPVPYSDYSAQTKRALLNYGFFRFIGKEYPLSGWKNVCVPKKIENRKYSFKRSIYQQNG